jgi:ribonuclease-3
LKRSAALEKQLGHRFGNAALLERALTHRSFGAEHNERLEFLGDGVLGCAVAEELYGRFPDLPEGKLTQMRAALVRAEALAEVARTLQLQDFLRLGASQVQPSILADALEAIFGAVFLDGGYEAARKAIVQTLDPLLSRLDPYSDTKDAKTRLQELMQARHEPLPEYHVIATHGEAHNRSFDVECLLSTSNLTTTGSGSSRQRAEQQAAIAMLEKLQK